MRTIFDPARIDPALLQGGDAALRRIEESRLNASTPREQMLYEGWLLRWGGDSRPESHCVIPSAADLQHLPERLAYCDRHYARHGMTTLVRVTPMSPPGLDGVLADAGYEAVGEGRVMTADISQSPDLLDTGLQFELVDREVFARESGKRLGSTLQSIEATVERLSSLPMEAMPLLAMHRRRCVGGVLVVLDDAFAAVCDLVVDPNTRGLGIGRSLLAAGMRAAQSHGAVQATMQLDPNNHPARALCIQFGFVDRYACWYRRAPEQYAD